MSNGLEKAWEQQTKKKANQVFANSINEVLNFHGIKEKINHTHLLRIQGNSNDDLVLSYFQNRSNDRNKLAKIIEKYIWNVVEKDTYLYHFTSEESARSIEQTGILRLYNILKRYSEGEIKDFINDFNIPYTQKDNYQNIFYTSMTPIIPKLSDSKTIENFRDFTGSLGARLKFKLLQKDDNLRHITYEQDKFKIIHDLRKMIKEKHNMDLIINGFTTRFASFYVNQKYSFENEVRLYSNLLWDEELSTQYNTPNIPYVELVIRNSILQLEEVIYEFNEEIFDEDN